MRKYSKQNKISMKCSREMQHGYPGTCLKIHFRHLYAQKKTEENAMTYGRQKAWREVEAFLPEAYQFNADYKPAEEFWRWKGNNVHLDTFRNADAKSKSNLFSWSWNQWKADFHDYRGTPCKKGI